MKCKRVYYTFSSFCLKAVSLFADTSTIVDHEEFLLLLIAPGESVHKFLKITHSCLTDCNLVSTHAMHQNCFILVMARFKAHEIALRLI